MTPPLTLFSWVFLIFNSPKVYGQLVRPLFITSQCIYILTMCLLSFPTYWMTKCTAHHSTLGVHHPTAVSQVLPSEGYSTTTSIYGLHTLIELMDYTHLFMDYAHLLTHLCAKLDFFTSFIIWS